MSELSVMQRATVSSVLARTISQRLLLALLVAAGLFAMGVWLGPLYNSMSQTLTELVASLPGGTIAIFGDIAAPAGWFNAEIFAFSAPALIIYVALASASRSLAEELEDRSVALLAANPVDRIRVYWEKLLGMAVLVTLVAAGTALGIMAGVALAGLDLATANILAMSLQVLLLGLMAGTLTALTSVLFGRRILAMVSAAVILLVCYAWGTFLELSDSLAGLAKVSPWYWYYGEEPLTEGLPWFYSLLLLALSVLVAIGGAAAFRRRELPA